MTREFTYSPLWCMDCDRAVAVTEDAEDMQPMRFECDCRTLSPASAYPESWMHRDDHADNGGEREHVEIDRVVGGATDLSMLGVGVIGDAAAAVGGEPSDAGFLPEKVRVSGRFTVTPESETDDNDSDGGGR